MMFQSKLSSPRGMLVLTLIMMCCFVIQMIQRSMMTTSIDGRQKQEKQEKQEQQQQQQQFNKAVEELSKLVSELKQLKTDLKSELHNLHAILDEYDNEEKHTSDRGDWDIMKHAALKNTQPAYKSALSKSSTSTSYKEPPEADLFFDPFDAMPGMPINLANFYRTQGSAAKDPFETNQNDTWLLNHATDEWNSSTISSNLIDPDRWKDYIKLYDVKLPGVPSSALAWRVPYFHSTPSWLLSKRTFLAELFFCPPNGHEGAITHLIGQLLFTAKPKDGSFVDVGSSLGFYSLMAWKMGYNVYAMDIQPMCLWMLHNLAQYNEDNINSKGDNIKRNNVNKQNQLHLHLMGLSDTKAVVENSEGGCDYENYYLMRDPKTNKVQRPDEIYDPNPAGRNVRVPILSLDQWIEIGKPQLPIRVMKIDTEGAEGKILLGMTKTLSSHYCPIQNFIVEITPAHWYRFGGKKDMESDTDMINAFVNVVKLYRYKAYLLYTDETRKPPTKFHTFLRPLSKHPSMPNVKDTGCDGAKFYAIEDMRRFFTDYCFDFASTVIRPGGKTAKGFCGNVWFQKEEKECKRKEEEEEE